MAQNGSVTLSRIESVIGGKAEVPCPDDRFRGYSGRHSAGPHTVENDPFATLGLTSYTVSLR